MWRYLLSLSALALVACNGGEDFSDAEIGGQVIRPSPVGNPLNPDVEATEVVFLSGGASGGDDTAGVVNNLGYRCGGTVAYIPQPGNTDGEEGTELEPNVARCPTSATSIEFFIGAAVGGDEDSRLSLGRAWLPAVANQGRFQFSPADLIESPSRVSTRAVDQARNITALLQALDSDEYTDGTVVNTPDVIEIPDFAHEMIQNAGVGDPPIPEPPSPPFTDYASYVDFTQAWENGADSWMNYLRNNTGGSATYTFPGEEEAYTQIELSLDRAIAGTYNALSIGTTQYGFILSQLDRTQDVVFQMPILVYPDGSLVGVGLMFDKSTEPQQSVVTMSGGAHMSREGALSQAQAEIVPTEPPEDTAELTLSGRVLGSLAYYDDSSDSVESDYRVDYPDAEFAPGAADRARYQADTTLFSVDDGLYWLTRTGQVAINLDDSVVQALEMNEDDRFYDIALYRACVDVAADATGCTDIPDNELGGVNYPDRIDSDGSNGADPGVVITQEKGKEGVTGSDTTIRVQILDNGDIVTDRDEDCAPVNFSGGATGVYIDTNGNTQEDRVGFVTRTSRTSPGNNPESFNIAIFMAGDVSRHDQIEQFGTQVQGRIDVRNGSGFALYRLSDQSFEDGIRALWTDVYMPKYLQDQLDPGSTDYGLKHQISASSSGAAQGGAVDVNACRNP